MTTATMTAEEQAAFAVFQAMDDAHRQAARTKCELLKLIREFDGLGLAPQAGATTTANYLMRRFGMAPSTAQEHVSTAIKLGLFPLLEREFEMGNLTYSAVRLLLRYLTEENERELVKLGTELNWQQLTQKLSAYHDHTRSEDPPDPFLRVIDQPDGGLRFYGYLNASDGASFKSGLKLGEIAYYNIEELAEDSAEGSMLDDGDLDAARSETAQSEPAKPVRKTASGFGLPVGRMMVQALMGMVHLARTTKKNTLLTPAAHVNILATKDGRAYMPNNVGARSDAIAGMVANANMRVSTVNENGLIINTGRQFRLTTPAQVNALLIMWGGQCAAPGCTHTRFIEMHHIKEWADGGRTDLENLLPLCTACHSLVSDGYLRTLKDGHDIHFLYRDGSRYVSRNYSMPTRDDSALTMEEFEQLINEETQEPDILDDASRGLNGDQ